MNYTEEWRLTDQELAKLDAVGGNVAEAQQAKKKAWLEANPKREMSYTKGEWRVDRKHIYDESGRTLALLVDGGYEEMEANAHLIAAAPDLYEACNKAWSYFMFRPAKTQEMWDILHQLEGAIAKAEGK